MCFTRLIILTAVLLGAALQTGCSGSGNEAVPPEKFVANPGIPALISSDEETNVSDSQK